MVFHKRKKTLRIIVEKYSISGGFGQEVGGGGMGGVEEGKGWREREVFDPKFLVGRFFNQSIIKI